jgi:F-type H+/Na+-transporting ATPase subunit alpha
VSAYIPTNVISITDGQIFLESDLFFSGVRPAINVGISVSRVGGNAQIKAMKQVAGRLRLDLAQFRELEAFAEFGSDLDKASQAQLDRGARIVEVLKQRQFTPYPVEDQVMSIWAATNGFLDDLPVERVQDFESGLLDHLRSRHSGIGESIRDTGKLEDDTIEQLRKAVQDFKESYAEQVETVETAAAEEGVPEVSESPAAEGGDATAVQQPGGSADEGEEDEEAAG